MVNNTSCAHATCSTSPVIGDNVCYEIKFKKSFNMLICCKCIIFNIITVLTFWNAVVHLYIGYKLGKYF